MRGDGPGTAREARIRERGRMGPPSPRRAPGPVPGRLHRPGAGEPRSAATRARDLRSRRRDRDCGEPRGDAAVGAGSRGGHRGRRERALALDPAGILASEAANAGLACRVAGPRRGGPGKAGGGSRRRGTWARRRTEPAHAHRRAVGTAERGRRGGGPRTTGQGTRWCTDTMRWRIQERHGDSASVSTHGAGFREGR